jgi:hypothetical protein
VPQSADHLEAVTMEPKLAVVPGAAAETLARAAQRRSILVFAALGVLSGVLCYFVGKHAIPELLRFSFWPLGSHSGAAPIVPGVIFGILVAGCCRRFGSKDWLALVVAVLVTTAAWILAYDLTVQTDSHLGDFHQLSDLIAALRQGPDVAPSTDPGIVLPGVHGTTGKLPFSDAISFGVGGLVGGLGTCLAVALANPRFRRPGALMLTLLVATALGAIEKVYDLMGEAGLLALFVVWQSAVIASIARGLTKP